MMASEKRMCILVGTMIFSCGKSSQQGKKQKGTTIEHNQRCCRVSLVDYFFVMGIDHCP